MRVLKTVCQHRQIKSLQFKAEHVCETQPGSILLVEREGFRQGRLPRRGIFEVGLQRGQANLNEKYAFDLIRMRGVQPSPGARIWGALSAGCFLGFLLNNVHQKGHQERPVIVVKTH